MCVLTLSRFPSWLRLERFLQVRVGCKALDLVHCQTSSLHCVSVLCVCVGVWVFGPGFCSSGEFRISCFVLYLKRDRYTRMHRQTLQTALLRRIYVVLDLVVVDLLLLWQTDIQSYEIWLLVMYKKQIFKDKYTFRGTKMHNCELRVQSGRA